MVTYYVISMSIVICILLLQVQLYILHVEATDKDPSKPLMSNVTLYINVIDINDNEPVFSPSSYSPLVSEDVDTGSVVVTVSADDEDAGMVMHNIRSRLIACEIIFINYFFK